MRKFIAILLLALGLSLPVVAQATPVAAGMTGCFAGQYSSVTAVAGCSSLGGNVVSIRVWIVCSSAPTTYLYGPYVFNTSNYFVSGRTCASGHITDLGYVVQRFPTW